MLLMEQFYESEIKVSYQTFTLEAYTIAPFQRTTCGPITGVAEVPEAVVSFWLTEQLTRVYLYKTNYTSIL